MSGLESEYKGRVRGQNLDATTEENKKIVQSLGFEKHGLVIRAADGKVLWLSGRYNSEVYAMDTTDGHTIAIVRARSAR